MNYNVNSLWTMKKTPNPVRYNHILDKYDEQDGDWDDIISPDDYDTILDMKRYNKSMGNSAWG